MSLSTSEEVIRAKGQWWVAEAINDLKTEYFGITAGLGAGKTHGALTWHHDRCTLNYRAEKSAVLTISYQKVYDAIIPTYEKVLESLGWRKGIHYRVVKSPYPKLVYYFGHEVHFLSAQKPETIVASEYSHATVSEAGSIDEEPVELLDTRVRDNRSKALQMTLEGVTQGTNNWYYKEYDYTPNHPHWKMPAPREYRNDKYNRRRFRVSTYDNPFVPESYIKKLLRIYENRPAYIRAWVFGFFVPLFEGNVYDQYSPARHDCQDYDADPRLKLSLTWDFNNNPVSWIAIQDVWREYMGERFRKKVALDESMSHPGTLGDAVDEFIEKYPVREFADTEIVLYGDSSGHAGSHRFEQSDFSDYKYIVKRLEEAGYKNVEVEAIKFNPKETETILAVNHLLEHDEILICERCTELKRSLVQTIYKKRERKIDKPNNDDWTHKGDAFKYHCYVDLLNTGRGRVFGVNA